MPTPTRSLVRRPVALLLTALVAACASAGSGAPDLLVGDALPHEGVRVPMAIQLDIHDDLHTVEGSNPDELLKSIFRNGPSRGRSGTVYHGWTQWGINWRYDYDRSRPGVGCRLADVRLSVDIRMPRWTPPEGVDPELVTRWEAYWEDLRAHEYGHRDITVYAARRIYRGLREVRAPTCELATLQARDIGSRFIREARGAGRAYDADPPEGRRVRWIGRRTAAGQSPR